jgi:hypothetical protein
LNTIPASLRFLSTEKEKSTKNLLYLYFPMSRKWLGETSFQKAQKKLTTDYIRATNQLGK